MWKFFKKKLSFFENDVQIKVNLIKVSKVIFKKKIKNFSRRYFSHWNKIYLHTIFIFLVKLVGYVRYIFAFMICIANMIIYGLKVNITVAVVGMVKYKDDKNDASEECEFEAIARIIDIQGPFKWTSTQQSFVISSYFIGYLIGMFPCGYFADR